MRDETNLDCTKTVAVIMAGGKGTRIAALNSTIPKPLLPVAGKPVLEHEIACLKQQGITNLVFTVSHMAEQIIAHFGDGSPFGVHIEYIREEMPLGTGGALFYLRDKVQDDFLLLNGDMIFDVDFQRLLTFHKAHNADATLLVHPNDHPYDSGLIIADEDGCVHGWLTKEDERGWYSNSVNAGIHVLSPRMLDKLTEPKKTDLDRDILKPSIPAGKIYAYRSPEYVKDMGTPERIREVERDIESGRVRSRNLACKQKAIFLDRDGTINKYVGFLRNIDDFELLDGAAEAIRAINRSGYLAIVVTNQPVIARGEVSWEELREIHRKMETLLGQKGAYVDGIFICPHHPDKGFPGERPEYKIDCDCRKPKPGLLLQAAERYNIDLAASWMIGDSANDMAAGKAAGCQTIRVGDGMSLGDAVQQILATHAAN